MLLALQLSGQTEDGGADLPRIATTLGPREDEFVAVACHARRTTRATSGDTGQSRWRGAHTVRGDAAGAKL